MSFSEDRKIKKMAKKENISGSQNYSNVINQTLYDLKCDDNKIKLKTKIKAKFDVAFSMLVFAFVLFVNLNPQIAYAMQEIPVVGSIVKIVTIKNYFEKDGNSEIDLAIPNIKNSDDTYSESNEKINNEINTLTQRIIDEYYKEKNPENHKEIKLDSEVVEDTKDWFTLKLAIYEASGSSDTQYEYYHIDKNSDKIVKLSDLFKNEKFKNVINEEIKSQMKMQMQEDEEKMYWLNEEYDDNFESIKDNQNFYFSDNGNIVIVFNKYEVGPGSTGTPEFEIDKTIYEMYLK